jgi:hypothetical protein
VAFGFIASCARNAWCESLAFACCQRRSSLLPAFYHRTGMLTAGFGPSAMLKGPPPDKTRQASCYSLSGTANRHAATDLSMVEAFAASLHARWIYRFDSQLRRKNSIANWTQRSLLPREVNVTSLRSSADSRQVPTLELRLPVRVISASVSKIRTSSTHLPSLIHDGVALAQVTSTRTSLCCCGARHTHDVSCPHPVGGM